MQDNTLQDKVVLITGGARRIGARIARTLHQAGMRLIIHYRSSDSEARALQKELVSGRAHSVTLVKGDLLDVSDITQVIEQAVDAYGRLDAVINNASTFYPTPVGEVSEAQWDDLIGTNLKAPFFVAQAAAPQLRKNQGCIINLADIYGLRPLASHPVYSSAKAGLIMLTKSLAQELAPEVRVNAVAPGAILWPESKSDEIRQQQIIAHTPLKRMGAPDDISAAVLFLLRDATFTTGHVLTVDGGRSGVS